MTTSAQSNPRVWDGWLRLKGGVEVAGIWIDKRDYDREIERLREALIKIAALDTVFPETFEGYGAMAVVTARQALKR